MIAMEEVRRGLVKYQTTVPVVPEPVPAEPAL
jgi:hypothetical protein